MPRAPGAAVLKSVNPLGFSLFRLLASRGEDALVSPLCISACLSMVAAGATAGSQAEKELMALLKTLLPNLPPASEVQMFNSAWVRARIRPDFVEAVQKKLGAEAHELMDADPSPINAWVKEKTLGRLPTLFDSLDALTVMVLVSTVFFNGTWATVFDADLTQTSQFEGFSGPRTCHMMRRKEKDVAYTENEIFQAVQLPYVGRKTWATILLPKAPGPDALAEVAASLEKIWHPLKLGMRRELCVRSLHPPHQLC